MAFLIVIHNVIYQIKVFIFEIGRKKDFAVFPRYNSVWQLRIICKMLHEQHR